MPSSKSAKKRVVQNEKARQKSKAEKSAMRSQVKRVKAAIEAGDAEKAQAEFSDAARRLDKAAKRSVIHKNQAARRKSRLQKLVNRTGK